MLSGPIDTKCLMYVNARFMVITDQQAVMTIDLHIAIHKTFGFNRTNLSLRGKAS